MAEQFQTSFIPKKVAETTESRNITGSGIFLFVGVISATISVALLGGVYAYSAYLNTAVSSKQEQLQKQRDAFAPEIIREMTRLSDKIFTVEELLSEHVAVSEIFEILQEATLKTVQFSSFGFDSAEDTMRVTLNGRALSFSSVALQADEFSKNPNLSESVFSDFALDDRGNVTFVVSTNVNPRVVSYKESVGRRGDAVLHVPEQGFLQELQADDTSEASVITGDTSTGEQTVPVTGTQDSTRF